MQSTQSKEQKTSEWCYIARREESFEENIEVHLHDSYEIYYFKEGKIGYFVEGSYYTASPGDMFITNPKELHTPIIEKGCYDRACIQFQPTFLEKISDQEVDLFKGFEDRNLGAFNKIEASVAEEYGLHTLFKQLELAMEVKDTYQILQIRCLITQMVLCINRLFQKQSAWPQKSVKQNDKVTHILGYINQNLFSKITLGDIQKECFVNRYYLCHLFKKHTGVSIYDYITNKRIMAAKKHILNDVPIIRVCYDVGFNDYSAFYKAFVKIENKSPKDFWKENKKKDERGKKIMKTFKLSGFADEIASDLDTQIEAFKRLGIKSIEMRGVDGKNISELTIEEAKAIKARLAEQQMNLSAIGSPIGKINIQDDFEPELERFKHVLELSRIFEVKYIRMFSFYIPKDEEKEPYFEEVVSRWEQYLEAAKDYDVILLHENEKGIYGDTGKRCQQLVERLNHPKVGVTFDPANFVQVHENVMSAYECLKDRITYLHIKDADEKGHNVPAGEGIGEVKVLLQELKNNGYTGYLSLEPHLASFEGKGQLEEGCQEEETRKEHRYYVFKKAYDALKYLLEA